MAKSFTHVQLVEVAVMKRWRMFHFPRMYPVAGVPLSRARVTDGALNRESLWGGGPLSEFWPFFYTGSIRDLYVIYT